jgi:hypothetical protein
MPLTSAQAGPATIITGRYYPTNTGLTEEDDLVLGARVQRALNRLTETEWDLYVLAVREHVAAGFADDVADAMALDEVYGGDRWRRFRK